MNNLYDQQTIESIRAEIKVRLSEEKYTHSCRVAELARDFVEKAHHDASRAEVAGLLHDIAREYSQEQIEETVQKYHVTLSRFDWEFPPSIHGKVGAAVAEYEFGIHDQEVLNAIRNHVTGRPCLHPLEEILYVADHIDHTSFYYNPEWYEQEQKVIDLWNAQLLDEAAYQALSLVIQFDVKKGRRIDERSELFFDWLLDKIEKKNQPAVPGDVYKQKLKEMDGRIDFLTRLYLEHRILIPNVRNLRDLGGYRTLDGRKVKTHRILRSGNLDRFTPEDYRKLTDMGINYVVDLRETDESGPYLENDIPGIHYVSLPFRMTFDFINYSKKLMAWIDECNSLDEEVWLGARYFDSMDINRYYMEMMFNPRTMDIISEILKIMLRSDCTGILYFCQSGKDRTGIVSSFVMNALGVDPKDILDDYMASLVSNYALTMYRLDAMKNNGFGTNILDSVFDVIGVNKHRPEVINKAVLSKYGDFGNFFHVSGFLTPEEVKLLKTRYLE